MKPKPKRKSLSRVLSQRGYCSRKDAEMLIREGCVKVNGKIIFMPHQPVPAAAQIEIVGKKIEKAQTFYYAVMNKRRGRVTTTADELGRKTVYEDLKAFLDEQNSVARLLAVGRLDKDTDGLLLFTNDNAFAEFLTNPDNQIPKTYRATLARPISESDLNKLKQGIGIEARGASYFAKPQNVKQLSKSQIELCLTEGKNREARRLFEALDHKVIRLTRTEFGKLRLDQLNLEHGNAKWLSREDII